MSDALRAAIRNSGHTAMALAEIAGVPQPTITRFLNGADIRLSRAEKLAKAVGLELKPIRGFKARHNK